MDTNHDPWLDVTAECPLRICRTLHERGDYRHLMSVTQPGRVLCFCRNGLVPELLPTVAQARAEAQEERNCG